MSPLSRLARLLHVKEKSAWDFYKDVQKGFEKKPPDIQAINNCIIQNNPKSPTPGQIIGIIKGEGDASDTKNLGPQPRPEPKRPRSGDDGATKHLPPKPTKPTNSGSVLHTYQKQRRRNRSGDLQGYTGRLGSLRSQRDTRNFNKQIARCPHGVLSTKKCAICDPNGFAALTNID
jgi:hypothetical protein